MIEYDFQAPLFRWQTDGAAWHFVALPTDLSDEIQRIGGALRGGWGSIKVEATIGATSWRTSIFPSREHGYLLPVKAAVRDAEGLSAGKDAAVTIRLG